jgi:hypothetical protein
MEVTTDGVRIGNRINYTLQHATRNYALQIAVTHMIVTSVSIFTSLLVTTSNGGRAFYSGLPNCLRASGTGTLDRFFITELSLDSSSLIVNTLQDVADASMAQAASIFRVEVCILLSSSDSVCLLT